MMSEGVEEIIESREACWLSTEHYTRGSKHGALLLDFIFPFGLSADDLSAVVLTKEEVSEEVYRRLIPNKLIIFDPSIKFFKKITRVERRWALFVLPLSKPFLMRSPCEIFSFFCCWCTREVCCPIISSLK
jgi:hypothetical protein